MDAYHVAQMNYARMRGTLTDPVMKEFAENLERIDALGKQAAGFVYLLEPEEETCSALRPFADDHLLINLSVWESIDALFQFTYYHEEHADFYRRRREWFEKSPPPYLVLWWIPAGHKPTAAEGEARLAYLAAHGASPYAFTFKQRFTIEEMLAYQPIRSEPTEAAS